MSKVRYNIFEVMDMQKEIYLAAGCFWGAEKAFQSLNGVIDTTVGFANGNVDNPSYQLVKTSTTGHLETVKIVYDDSVISLNKLLKGYFLIIDPTLANQQGHDIGSQYQTGIYYNDPESEIICRNYWEQEKRKYPVFMVELAPLKCFWSAEEYHQDYLIKNPTGYCHVSLAQYAAVRELNNE